jgi:uncharacterized membrane protein
VSAGLIDEVTAGRIRAFEATQSGDLRLGWPVRLAIGLGGVLLGAGVLLFVEAQWDELSPLVRFLCVVSLVAAFHLGGALAAEGFAVLSASLHALGTASLGAGIFLCGQIFNLDEHWPSGVLLWALGASLGFALLRSWPQLVFTALLWPAWVASEWLERIRWHDEFILPLIAGLVVLAVCYFTAPDREVSPARRTLSWIGGIPLVPLVCLLIFATNDRSPYDVSLPFSEQPLGWAGAISAPLVFALAVHRQRAWQQALGAAWTLALYAITSLLSPHAERSPFLYLWCGLGSLAMSAWGVGESRSERINLGIAGFAVTVIAFYFVNVFDKLGRAASLVSMGALFLGVGVALERTRRRLLRRVQEASE